MDVLNPIVKTPNATNSSIQQSLRLDYILTLISTTHHPPHPQGTLPAQLAGRDLCTSVQSQTSAATLQIDCPNVPYILNNNSSQNLGKANGSDTIVINLVLRFPLFKASTVNIKRG